MDNAIEPVTRTDVAVSLRQWARGVYPQEAAVELLLRAFHGRFARPGNPWIRPTDDGGYRLDSEALASGDRCLSGGEQRLLQVVAALAGDAQVSLSAAIPGMDRDLVELVLAAIAHAAGSHEHANIVVEHDAGVAHFLGHHPSLHPWPALERPGAQGNRARRDRT